MDESAARTPVRSGGEPPSPPPDDPDRELVERAAAGDPRAFDLLLRRHYERIYRFAWRSTRSPADAQDIAQEVCCTLLQKIGTFKGEARFTTWLMGVVNNACHDHYRRRERWKRIHGNLLRLAGCAPNPDGRGSHDPFWLIKALERLDEPFRETFRLVFGEGKTHAEAGKLLGVAESTVSSRIHEARRKLGGDGEDA